MNRTEIRKLARIRRNQLSLQQQHEASRQIVGQVKNNLQINKGDKVALYLTNDGELETSALIEYLINIEAEVYLPVIHPFSQVHLMFLHYTVDTQMRVNKFGINEPPLSCPDVCPINQLDWVFMPLVAFDDEGNRLGMGGGFYDRTFAHLSQPKARCDTSTQPKLIGLAHDCQQVEKLPIEPWDVPLPMIMTPTFMLRN